MDGFFTTFKQYRNLGNIPLTQAHFSGKMQLQGGIRHFGQNGSLTHRRIHVTDTSDTTIMRGYVDECLRHYLQGLQKDVKKGTKGSAKAWLPIADFCGVTPATVAKWLYQENQFPKGEKLTKVICWLQAKSYAIIELDRMSPSTRGFVELLGYGIITNQEAASIVGYPYTTDVFRLLYGRIGTTQDKSERMWTEWSKRREELEAKKQQVRMAMQRSNTSAPEPDQQGVEFRGPFVVMLALCKLLEESTPKGLSPEEKQQVGELMEKLNRLFPPSPDEVVLWQMKNMSP